MSKTAPTARMHRNGALHRQMPDGTEQPMPPAPPMREMTDAEVQTAAHQDPDAHPLTDDDMRQMPRIPRAKTLRRALGLTQEEFATRDQIPLGTLRDWEQGRTEPDQPARAYLKAIAGNPEAVHRALDGVSRPPQ